jgi:tripartite-type tricarboxylate transporter receptor subunit TctC
MRRPRRSTLHFATAAAALTVASVIPFTFPNKEALSQTTRTIKIVVPLAPGGTADTLARILGEQISRDQGVTVVIENRPGGGTVIGTEAVSRAAPDGNTLLVTAPAFVISSHLRKRTYDPLTSFEPICQLTRTPMVIAVNSSSPYRTLADFLEAGRTKPGSLTLASVPGSIAHVAFEMLKRAAKVDLTFVPYSGDAPAVNDLLGGHVASVLVPYAGVVGEQVKAGALRVLASASRVRGEPLSDVPTVAEAGYKDYEVDFWNGVLAPANTPKDTVSQLAAWFSAAMQVPEVNAKLVAQGFYPIGLCGSDFGALLRRQYDDFGRIIRDANIKPE